MKGVCARCRRLPRWDELAMESEHPACWARRFIHEHNPHELADVFGAMQIVLESMRGAGDGTPARKKRPSGRMNGNLDRRRDEGL